MIIRILSQCPFQMDLLEAAQAALPYLQGAVRERLEKALSEMDGQVVITTWSLEDFTEGEQACASKLERERALYHLYKYFDATPEYERLQSYLGDIVRERDADTHLKVTLAGGHVRFVPASEVWKRVMTEGEFDTVRDAAASLLDRNPRDIESVDVEVHYRADGTPITA